MPTPKVNSWLDWRNFTVNNKWRLVAAIVDRLRTIGRRGVRRPTPAGTDGGTRRKARVGHAQTVPRERTQWSPGSGGSNDDVRAAGEALTRLDGGRAWGWLPTGVRVGWERRAIGRPQPVGGARQQGQGVRGGSGDAHVGRRSGPDGGGRHVGNFGSLPTSSTRVTWKWSKSSNWQHIYVEVFLGADDANTRTWKSFLGVCVGITRA
jgi:hypothetical protein